MRSIGYWRPITPVDAINISFEEMPSLVATLPAISTAFCMQATQWWSDWKNGAFRGQLAELI